MVPEPISITVQNRSSNNKCASNFCDKRPNSHFFSDYSLDKFEFINFSSASFCNFSNFSIVNVFRGRSFGLQKVQFSFDSSCWQRWEIRPLTDCNKVSKVSDLSVVEFDSSIRQASKSLKKCKNPVNVLIASRAISLTLQDTSIYNSCDWAMTSWKQIQRFFRPCHGCTF